MNRLENLRQHIDTILNKQPDAEGRRCGFVHLYGVAVLAALLALRRGLDSELASIAAMLHDISTYQSGEPTHHATRSALEANQMLGKSGDFTPEEIATICAAIAHHSEKVAVHSTMAELLKDADALHHFLYNPALSPHRYEAERLARVRADLQID